MARPMKPLVRVGGYYPSNKWIPLVYNGGYTTMDGGEEPEPPTPVYWKTITGVSPLALANAIADYIRSITQYGKCVQDGTPTPDAPVDIVTNNGALRMVDDELPTGYKRLLGITFDGEVYYVTNYHLRGADTLRLSFKATKDARNVLGCYNGPSATDNLSFYFSAGSTGVYLRYNGGLYRPVAYLNTVYNCVISPTGVTGLSTGASWTEADFTSAAALFIGWLDNATSPKFMGDMYGSIVVEDRANIIPVERQSDGAIGYWDGQAFLENQGTGTPVSLGYDDSHYQLSVDGTPEVLTVRGKNLFDPTKVLFGYYRDFSTGNKRTSSVNFMSSDDDYIPCLPNTAYTFVGVNKTDGTYSKYNTIYFFDSAKNYLGASSYQISQPTTSTTPSNCRYLQVRSNPLDTWSVSIQEAFQRFNWQLELGSTATDYEPYHAQTVTVPTLLSVDTVKDEWEAIYGPLTHRIGLYVITGSDDEGWEENSSYAGTFYADCLPAAALITTFSMFTRYEGVLGSRSVGSMANGTAKCGSSSNRQRIFIRDVSCANVDALKAKLSGFYAAGEPCIVAFALATEQTEQTTPHSLHSYNGTTIVTAQTNVDPVTLSVEYASSEEE